MFENKNKNRVTILVDDKMYKRLVKEMSKRKVNQEVAPTISGVVRDALEDYFAAQRAA